MFYLDEPVCNEGVFESLIIEQPRSVEENIRRGRNAFHRVMISHSAELMAMFRKELGWIGFEWGTPGEEPPEFASHEEFRKWQKTGHKPYDMGGHGISHILAKRDWEGIYIEEFSGQTGISIVAHLVEALAKGTITSGSTKATIKWNDWVIICVKKRSGTQAFWLLTGYEKPKAGYKYVPKIKTYDGMFESAGEYGCLNDQTPHLRTNGLHFSVHSWEQQTQVEYRLATRENKVNNGWLYDL